jgi:predicted PurR-regulated permease PerM
MSDATDNAKKVGIPAAATVVGVVGGLFLLGPIGAVIGGIALGVSAAAVVKKTEE